MLVKVIFVLLTAAAMLFAASPIGSVSSLGPVEVSGATFSASTVSSWPLVSGDEIVAKVQPAVVFLPGNGRVTLQTNSRIRVEKNGEQMSVRLLGGALSYNLLAGSHVIFLDGARTVTPGARTQGTLGASRSPSPARGKTIHAIRTPTPSNVNPF